MKAPWRLAWIAALLALSGCILPDPGPPGFYRPDPGWDRPGPGFGPGFDRGGFGRR